MQDSPNEHGTAPPAARDQVFLDTARKDGSWGYNSKGAALAGLDLYVSGRRKPSPKGGR